MAFKRILLRRDTASNWTSGNAVLASGEIGYETNTGKFKIGNGSTAWTSLGYSIASNISSAVLNDLGDVTITSAANGDFLKWNGTAFVNDSIDLGTDTTGNYVATITGGTGVASTAATSGEGTTHTLSIGQAVGTADNVTFAGVTADAIKIGVTAAGEIDTTSGDLTIDSAGGTVTVDDNLTITGNLTVSGTTTSVNTETLTVDDNIIVLNNNVTASPSENAGIEVERGSSTNVVLRWNETDDAWELTNDGTTYSAIATTSSVSAATALTIDNLTDVTITSVAADQVLQYNGTAWVNATISLTPDFSDANNILASAVFG